MEKAREKEMMDALLKQRTDEDKFVGEQKKAAQDVYKNALDLQKKPSEIYQIGMYDEKKKQAAYAMENAQIDPYRANPIVGGTGNYKPVSRSILKEAAMSALQSK